MAKYLVALVILITRISSPLPSPTEIKVLLYYKSFLFLDKNKENLLPKKNKRSRLHKRLDYYKQTTKRPTNKTNLWFIQRKEQRKRMKKV